MSEKIDPKKYGLSTRTVLMPYGKNHIALVINRKSRIIMADGKKILEKAEKIRAHQAGVRISLQTSAPVCSKTTSFLSEKKIRIISST